MEYSQIEVIIVQKKDTMIFNEKKQAYEGLFLVWLIIHVFVHKPPRFI